MAARATRQPEEPQPAEAEEDEVTTASDLGFKIPSREIEVDPIVEPLTEKADNQGMVEIRMSQTIEEFTYGNPHLHYNLQAGHRYRVPMNIATYLDSLGYVHH